MNSALVQQFARQMVRHLIPVLGAGQRVAQCQGVAQRVASEVDIAALPFLVAVALHPERVVDAQGEALGGIRVRYGAAKAHYSSVTSLE